MRTQLLALAFEPFKYGTQSTLKKGLQKGYYRNSTLIAEKKIYSVNIAPYPVANVRVGKSRHSELLVTSDQRLRLVTV